MKLVSWNVNGIRAVMQKDFLGTFNALNADIFCVQETKAQDEQVLETLKPLSSYWIGMNSALRKGYSGTAIISRTQPISISYGMGIAEHDTEGRICCAEFQNFYMVNVYVPNSGSELVRLDYRKQWDLDFCTYLKKLEIQKPIIVCGDFNVAHKPIDIARPESNYNKSAGYTQTEIDGMDRFVSNGFVDTFRYFNPDLKDTYSWWSYRMGARAKNIGWRIDYFLVSQQLTKNLTNASICPQYLGSDHCPILLELNI